MTRELLEVITKIKIPKRAAAEKKNKKILENVHKVTYRDMLSILKEMDQGFLKETLAEETFPELFFKQCEKGEISDYIHSVLGR